MYVESIRYHLLRAPTRAHAAHCDNPILFCGHPLHVGNQFSAKALQLLCSQGMLQKVPNLKANLVSITRPKIDKPTKYWPWKKSQPQGFKICSDSFRQGTPHPWPVKGGNIVCFSGLSTVSSTFPRLSASLSGKMSRELEGLRRTAWTGLGG